MMHFPLLGFFFSPHIHRFGAAVQRLLFPFMLAFSKKMLFFSLALKVAEVLRVRCFFLFRVSG